MADAVFYNFGNHAGFHRPILQAALAVPGVAVLHDLNMQHFFARYALSPSSVKAYLAVMRRHHGEEGEADARRFVANEIGIDALVDRYPLPLAAADRAIAIVGHNRTGMQTLAQQTRLPSYYLPLSTRFLDVAASVRQPAVPPYRLIVFGFIGANRRLSSTLHALAALSDRSLYTLDIYGAVEESVGVAQLVEELGLHSQVRVHGFVPTEELTAALHDAHLAVNLRCPTMGEASGSQLRIWAHALPALVTRIGWYADLPEDAVAFVEPEDEVSSLVGHLQAFHRDQRPYLAAGQRGREIALAEHSPDQYADGLLQIAAAAPAQHRHRAAIDMAAAMSQVLLDLMDPAAVRLVAPGPARVIADLYGPPK